jgi:hypothetical protein
MSFFKPLLVAALFIYSLPAVAADRVLFICGGDGTGGFLDGGSDDHQCDIDNSNLASGNHD